MSNIILFVLIIAMMKTQPSQSHTLMNIDDGELINHSYWSSPSGSYCPNLEKFSGHHLKACCFEVQ